MKSLKLWELAKGLVVATGALGASVALFGSAMAWSWADTLKVTAAVMAFVLLVAGFSGLAYALAQMSAGGELAARNFGASVGAYVGAYEHSRLQARGELPNSAVEAVEAGLVGAQAREQARDTGAPEGAVIVSRFRLNNALANVVFRWHEGLPISRSSMVADGVVDQRYWNLSTRCLIGLGMRNINSSSYRTLGSRDLDLAFVVSRVVVVAHKSVYIHPEGEGDWEQVDLRACHFLLGNEKGTPAGEEGASNPAGVPSEEVSHETAASDTVYRGLFSRGLRLAG